MCERTTKPVGTVRRHEIRFGQEFAMAKTHVPVVEDKLRFDLRFFHGFTKNLKLHLELLTTCGACLGNQHSKTVVPPTV